MLIKFINKSYSNDIGLHVFLNTGYEKNFEDLLKTYKLSSNNIGNKIKTEKNEVIFFQLDEKAIFYSTKKIAIKLATYNDKNICICLSNIDNKYKLLILQLIVKYLYSFNKYKNNKSGNTEQILIKDDNENKALIEDIIHQINITNINRDFQNEPANKIYPETFCKYASNLLGKNKHLKIKILNDKDLKKQGFNLIYDIGKASINKPRLMIVNYIQNPKYKTICLIGKGVCFDLGGANIKAGNSHLPQMKADKTGACTVVLLIKYIIESKMKLNIVGLIPLVENVISGNLALPGNIIKSYSGKSVEVTDIDAEGRLIIADALGFSDTLKNIDYVIDLATLTGGAGHYHCDISAVIYTINKELKNIVDEIGEEVGDRIYSLNGWPEYVDVIKSNVADVKNLYFHECPNSGTFTAAMFLSYFVPKHLQNKWVHFDICHNFTKNLSNGNTTILMINLLKRLSIKN
jgi:leucyl aminopeptidase